MRGEDIYEEGIVLSAASGRATVAVALGDACEECTAKVFCSAGESKQNTVEARDPFGVHAGDHVRIVVHGEDMFKAAFLLYGIPLLLILAGILLGTYVFDPGLMPTELWSFILGVGLAGAYYLVFFLNGGEARGESMMPDIILVQGRD
ncbi:MAG: SoxR reducing system RseC family protein [Bacteroidetes bacterium]|nr:SoxR reducing system RseC family protein [Bacteroidota bacterium]